MFLILEILSVLVVCILPGSDGQFDLCEYHGCVCDLEETKTISCIGLFFEYLPSLPNSLETLKLDGNHLTALRKASFEDAQELRTLIFTNNDLGFIDREAFQGLKSLNNIDLSGNFIASLPKDSLSHLLFLKSLNVSRNQLSDTSDILKAVGWKVSSKIMDSVDLSWNNFQYSNENYPLPISRHLSLAGIPIESFGNFGFYLKKSHGCTKRDCRYLKLEAEHWTVLQHLDVSSCNIDINSDLLAAVKTIKELNIAGNNMKNADLLSSLQQLEILEKLNVSGMKFDEKLVFWEIFFNGWKVLDISNLGLPKIKMKFLPRNSSLHELYASNNALRQFSLPEGFEQLRVLVLSHNHLSSLPLITSAIKKHDSLEILDLSFNHIQKIESNAFDAYPSLKVVNLRGNEIMSVSIFSFPIFELAVETLDLSENKIKALPSFLLPNLQTFLAYSNQMTGISNDSFTGLKALVVLDLSNNPELFAMDYSGAWLQQLVHMPYLQTLNMSNTGMQRFPPKALQSLHSLRFLNLSSNSLGGDSLFDSLPKCVVTLDVSNNRLARIPNNSFAVRRQSCLEKLDLSKNPFNCDCSLMPLKEIVISGGGQMIMENVEDVEKYYCFEENNHWRYPLYSFLEVLQPCGIKESLNILCLIAAVLCIMGGMTCAIVCCWKLGFLCGRKMSHNIQYFYRPLSTTEEPYPAAV